VVEDQKVFDKVRVHALGTIFFSNRNPFFTLGLLFFNCVFLALFLGPQEFKVFGFFFCPASRGLPTQVRDSASKVCILLVVVYELQKSF